MLKAPRGRSRSVSALASAALLAGACDKAVRSGSGDADAGGAPRGGEAGAIATGGAIGGTSAKGGRAGQGGGSGVAGSASGAGPEGGAPGGGEAGEGGASATGGTNGSAGEGGAGGDDATCGNGDAEGAEDCDDGSGNTNDCAYGLASCTVCTPTCRRRAGHAHYCGDGVLDTSETCDDGGNVASDGCNGACSLESGWVCTTTSPSKCTRPSCAGMSGTECNDGGDCCASPMVTGGTFTQGPDPGDARAFQSTVSSFRLDKYEVTVARFRAFIARYDAWLAGSNPAVGAGSNPNVSGSGWNPTFAPFLPASASELAASVQCNLTSQTWRETGNDTLPINCVDWYTAFAFCIWDGGRLPTESEWEYAAVGGALDTRYPWGNQPTPTGLPDPTAVYAVYACIGDGSGASMCAFEDILPVGSRPAGRGFYGQDDLAGSMLELTLDCFATYPSSATANYACISSGDLRTSRGGYWESSAAAISGTYRNVHVARSRAGTTGFRCARNP